MSGNIVESNRKHDCDIFPRKGYKEMESSHAERRHIRETESRQRKGIGRI